MEFREKLEKFIERIPYLKSAISDEEATKHSLILPFLSLLDYDVYDPREVKPEYVADFAKNKKKEKVDYCVHKELKPIFFLEAKPVNESLQNHDSQLSRYFNATPSVRFAILSNGIEYKFFTDIVQKNIMDDSPFYSFNLEKMANADFEFLERFTRERFDVSDLIDCSKMLMRNKAVMGALTRRPGEDRLLPGRPRRLDVRKMTVTIDKRLFKVFDEFAWQNRLNKSEVIRELITNYLEESGIAFE